MEYAADIDFQWNINKEMRVIMQFQFGSGAGSWAYLAQKIRRFEAGVGCYFKPNILLKCQWFFDDYQWDAAVIPLNGIAASNMDAGTRGFILVLNVLLYSAEITDEWRN